MEVGGVPEGSNLRNGPPMMLMMLAPVACIISIIGAPFHQFGGIRLQAFIRLQPFCFFVCFMMAFGLHREASN